MATPVSSDLAPAEDAKASSSVTPVHTPAEAAGERAPEAEGGAGGGRSESGRDDTSPSTADAPTGPTSPSGTPIEAASTAGVDAAVVARAEAFKNAGNDHFKAARYADAVADYSAAIEVLPSAVLFGNRAFAHLRMENFGSAIDDATAAIALDRTYVKGYYRRGSANLLLGHYREAKADFKAVVTMRPTDPDAAARLRECEAAMRRIAFEQAIALDKSKSVWDRLALDKMVVEASYAGPALPDIPELDFGLLPSSASVSVAIGSRTAASAASAVDDAPAASGGGGGSSTPSTPSSSSSSSSPSSPKAVSPWGMTLEFVHTMMEDFRLQKKTPKRYVMQILRRTLLLLRSLPTLVRADIPAESAEEAGSKARKGTFTVCGDTHGQYYDVLNIFKLNGEPSPTNPYLFNGDFVDRGPFAVEITMVLFAFKLLYPQHVHILRGNHETTNMNKMYGFEGEVLHKYDDKVYEMFTSVFQALPLAAVLGGKVFVVHGGIFSTDGVTLADIEKINRFCEPPEGGLMSDMLWSDPHPLPGRIRSKRGMGKSFGPDITKAFLESNGLSLLIRSHECKDDGYVVEHDGRCITVFSAPNYCDSVGNKGALVRLSPDGTPHFTQFDAVPHPPVRSMAYAKGLSSMMMGMM